MACVCVLERCWKRVIKGRTCHIERGEERQDVKKCLPHASSTPERVERERVTTSGFLIGAPCDALRYSVVRFVSLLWWYTRSGLVA